MHSSYISPVIRELRDQQIRLSAREKKIEQIDQAEKLLAEIDPKRTYSYQYVHFRITSLRPKSHADQKIPGEQAYHDLRLFVEDVSDSANLPADGVGEQVLTVEEVARRFRVSTKTVSRWRDRGLISRRFVVGGRKRVGFLESSVARFVADNLEQVQRGTRFSQLTDEEKERIIAAARRLARAGGCPADVTKRLADKTGRSVETIRYIVRQFDREQPEAAIFPDSQGPLQAESKRKIYHRYQRGESVEALAKRFCRTRASIYRIIGEMRAQRILELPLDYIPSEEFARARTRRQQQRLLDPMPETDASARRVRIPSGLPPYLASLYEVPLLTSEQEKHLFRKMNYLKYKASALRDQLDLNHPRRVLMDQIERLCDAAVATKNHLVRANLRLVVSIAKRHVGPADDFFELVSDGNLSLMRAVDKFDYSRGNKFSTYASWAIMKNFARTIPDEHRLRDRFRTSQSEMFVATEDERTDQVEQEVFQTQREAEVMRILGHLDEREQQIIRYRFGLRRGEEPLTLKQVGAQLGVTKERIRQIEARALSKLRKAAQDEQVEIPELE